MVPAMPIGVTRSAGIVRVALAAFYLVLGLLLNPALIQHELALPTDSHHSESDVCTWLDHVAGTSLQSAHADLTVADRTATVATLYHALLRSVSLFVDPSRGPPRLI